MPERNRRRAPAVTRGDPSLLVHRVIRHGGHYPWIEPPDAFYATVDAFLAGLRR